ncbi:MAG: GNAT family N-acetyltransferase [Cyanobacteria bacterium PR.3.49]|nr:GNAT family N-acetyltransferase [Cyanobacteria bacterium PR.3.49]
METKIELGSEYYLNELVDSALLMILDSEGRVLDRDTATRGVKAALENPSRGFYVIAKVDGQFAGSLFVNNFWLDLMNGFIWWINCVHVRKEYRRQGLYELMYDFVKNKAKSHDDVVALRLLVHPENLSAKSAYEKTGMSELPYLVLQQRL